MAFINQDRGLAIAGTGFTYLSEGAYAVIFIDRAAGRVIKVHKRRPEEDHVRAVFKAEADAYRLAAASAEVLELVPGKFRLCPPVQVVDNQVQDVTSEFFPDLAFETDFVKGIFYKIGIFGIVHSTEASRVCRLFWEAGIRHTTDMSVTVSAKGIVLKAIDFAVEEHELMHHE